MESRAVRISIIAAGVILVIIILIITLFSKKPTPTTNKNITPTPVSNYSRNARDIDYNSQDFSLQCSSQTGKCQVEKKTIEADQKIKDWVQENNLPQDVIDDIYSEAAINEATESVYWSGNPEDYFNNPERDRKKVRSIINSLLNIIFSTTNVATQTSINLPPTIAAKPTPKKSSGSLVYYPQCNGDYDSYPLPSGCTICKAGCGPTTVAMIVASYTDSKVTPPTIVDQYQARNQYLSCAGSGFSSAKIILESYGLRTSDYLFSYGLYPIDDVASDFKNYLNSGWTIFALANFRENGGGHYFWITDIDNNNTVWAYDPYYGRYQAPPLNENKYSPFPKYKIAFAVKKTG